MDLLREKHTPQTERGPSQKARGLVYPLFLDKETEVQRGKDLPKIMQAVNGRAMIGKFTASKSCTPNHLTILSLIHLIKVS